MFIPNLELCDRVNDYLKKIIFTNYFRSPSLYSITDQTNGHLKLFNKLTAMIIFNVIKSMYYKLLFSTCKILNVKNCIIVFD